MKRPSWREALPEPSRTQSRSDAPHRPDEQPAAGRPALTLKLAARTGDEQDVATPRLPGLTAITRRPLRRRWRALAVIPVVIAAAALAGCFSITGQTTVQEGEIGDVIVTTDMCLTMGASGCAGGLTDGQDAGDVQYLIGYLLPTWALEPPSISWKGDAGDLTLARNLGYENILQGFAPAPLGLRWVGYATGARPAPPAQTDQRMQAVGRIGVPDAAPGDLQMATVTGFRFVRDGSGGRTPLAEDRAFNCAEVTDTFPTTQCILSGQPGQATTPGNTPITEDIGLNTLSLGPPPSVPTIRAGNSAILRFPLSTNFKGEGNDTIPMRASSSLKGAKLEFPPNVILGGSGLPSEVKVTVPLVANTGDYTVTLQTANGLRKATGTIRVVGIRTLINAGTEDEVPVKTLKQGVAELRKYMRTAKSSEIRRGNTFDLPIRLPKAGTVTGTLVGKAGGSKKVTLSSGKSKIKIPGTATLHLTPKTAARSMLRSGRTLNGKLTLVFKPTSGKSQKASLTVKLK